MQLAVLSYPKHYHITQLAIAHAIKYIPNIDKVFLIWDDIFPIQPTNPLRTVIKQKFQLDECPMIKWSDIIPNIKGNNEIAGNVGQQIIKLHLDLVIKDDFIILDGDTIINHPIDPARILYSNRLTPNHKRFNHVYHSLGIPNYEFWTNPFMYVKDYWLRDLREHVENNTCEPISHAFRYDGRIFPIYEWELIAQYLLNILKLPLKIEYFDRKLVKTQNFEQFFNLEQNFVLDGPDDLSPTFMAKHGITVDKELMLQLNYTHA